MTIAVWRFRIILGAWAWRSIAFGRNLFYEHTEHDFARSTALFHFYAANITSRIVAFRRMNLFNHIRSGFQNNVHNTSLQRSLSNAHCEHSQFEHNECELLLVASFVNCLMSSRRRPHVTDYPGNASSRRNGPLFGQ
jgi:hypothetical protein